jgi:hypothetical protein
MMIRETMKKMMRMLKKKMVKSLQWKMRVLIGIFLPWVKNELVRFMVLMK